MASLAPVSPAFKLLIAFVNTKETGVPERELLADDAATARWLREHGLLDDEVAVGDSDVHDARAVREALRAMAMRNAGEPLGERSTALPAWCSQLSYRLAIDGETLDLQPAGARTTVRGALRAILALVYRAQIEGTWERFKACRQHSCLWTFYDQSRNRSGAWCSMAVCGNRGKAQRRRQRERLR